MILLWGLPGDPPLAMVFDALRRRGSEARLLDQRDLLRATGELSIDPELSAWIELDGSVVDLSRCAAMYLRPFDSTALPPVRRAGLDSALARRAARLDWLLLSWCDLTSALVINRPSAATTNDSKPWQAGVLRDCGFSVPDTLITTDPAAAEAFRSHHGRVIYKSISSTRSIVGELTGAALERIASVRWCPTQFQELIHGVDYRVHVVGEELFTTRIESTGIDYRYAASEGPPPSLHPATLPDEVAHCCVTATRRLGVDFGGIDLKLTEDGRWYCFELNTSPGFSYFQEHTGQPIAEAVARRLSTVASASEWVGRAA